MVEAGGCVTCHELLMALPTMTQTLCLAACHGMQCLLLHYAPKGCLAATGRCHHMLAVVYSLAASKQEPHLPNSTANAAERSTVAAAMTPAVTTTTPGHLHWHNMLA